jgi:thioredoxin 1
MIIRLVIGTLIGAGIGALMGYFGKCTSGTCPLTANPFRGAIIGAMLGALFASSYGRVRSESGRETPESTKAVTSISKGTEAESKSKKEALIHVNNQTDFKNYVLGANLPCLADFFSNSCPPCRMLAPTIEKLANKYKGRAVVCKVSLDYRETHALAQKYKITGIPTVLFFDHGTEIKRLIGLSREGEYSRVLDEMIKKKAQPEKER